MCISRFRPLTGILFFNGIGKSTFLRWQELFPSPYGDFVFQLIDLVCVVADILSFPSPYGDFVFQLF